MNASETISVYLNSVVEVSSHVFCGTTFCKIFLYFFNITHTIFGVSEIYRRSHKITIEEHKFYIIYSKIREIYENNNNIMINT